MRQPQPWRRRGDQHKVGGWGLAGGMFCGIGPCFCFCFCFCWLSITLTSPPLHPPLPALPAPLAPHPAALQLFGGGCAAEGPPETSSDGSKENSEGNEVSESEGLAALPGGKLGAAAPVAVPV